MVDSIVTYDDSIYGFINAVGEDFIVNDNKIYSNSILSDSPAVTGKRAAFLQKPDNVVYPIEREERVYPEIP